MRLTFFIALMLLQASATEAARNQVSVNQDNQYRYIESNGIPDHAYGTFPNRGNPHTVSEQNHQYRVALYPQLASSVTELEKSPFGVAINGIPFDPGTAEYYNNDRSSGWRYEALSGHLNLGMDKNNAHVQPSGAYHYHGVPAGLVIGQSKGRHSKIVGYAADGFPMYAVYGYVNPENPSAGIKELEPGYRLKKGIRDGGPGGAYDGRFVQDYEHVPFLGDLDECNGRFGPTPDYPEGTYHYFLTNTYPFIPRCYQGTPDSSFSRRGSGRGNHPPHSQGRGRGGPPHGHRGRPPHPPPHHDW